MAARALTTKKSFLIGIIYEDTHMKKGFEHPLFSGILSKFRIEMENSGYDLIFLSKSFGFGKTSYLDHCVHRNVDGVVVINPAETDSEILELASSDIPCVSTNDIIPGIPYVITENFDAGYKAAEYFIQNGHKKMCYIAGPSSVYTTASMERLEGFKKCLSENQICFDESLIETSPSWFRENGFNAMEKIWKRHNDVTAVFAANDGMAIGAMEYFQSIGVSVPDKVSFIGFDDELFSSYFTPTLTTFRQNRARIAEIAAEILCNRLAGLPVADCVRVDANFIVRDSVKDISKISIL